jgi:S-adenosylmethionine synthetase
VSYLFTSESVTGGHPDKLADQISDAVLDAYLREDRRARVAIETYVTNGLCLVGGEVRAAEGVHVDVASVARQAIHDAGYGDPACGFPAADVAVLVAVGRQSPEIAQGVDRGDEAQQGAGDQGLMFGYACRDTDALMPLPIHLAHGLARGLADLRTSGALPYLRPDGKTQVTVEYGDDGRPKRLDSVVVSCHHDETVGVERIRTDLEERLLSRVLPRGLRDARTRLHVNPTGAFTIGGPKGDTGLTGRKIVVDTYGGWAPHGGGAFSGKDPSKVDRSAAYAARWIAKNVVAAGLADACEVQLAYVIGVAEPASLRVRGEGWGRTAAPDAVLERAVRAAFRLTPAAIIRDLDLLRPVYRETAVGGHFGRNEPEFTWERTDRVEALKEAAAAAAKGVAWAR